MCVDVTVVETLLVALLVCDDVAVLLCVLVPELERLLVADDDAELVLEEV